MSSPFPVSTSEQIDLVSSYMKKWMRIATNNDRIDRVKVAQVIHKIYNLLNIESPVLLFADSPYAAYIILQELIEKQNYATLNSLSRNFTQDLKEKIILQIFKGTIISSYPAQIRHPNDELRSQLYNELHFSILGSVWSREVPKPLSGITFQTQSWPKGQNIYIATEDWACDAYYLDWLFNCLNCKHDIALWDLFESLLTECGWIFPFEKVCIISDRPIEIHFDDEKRLHAEGKPALVFSDGSYNYAHHGVKIPGKYGQVMPELWQSELYFNEKTESIRRVILQKLPSNKIDKNWLLTEPNRELQKLIVHRLGIEIKTLNISQVDALETYRQKWREIAFNTTPVDRQKAVSEIQKFYMANESAYEPKILFVDSPFVGRKLIKQKCRGQEISFGIDKSYGGYNGFVHPLYRMWNSINAQLTEAVLNQILDTLITKRSWKLDPKPIWVQPEKLSVWLSAFDFCISVLGCVHDPELWAISQAVFIECGWFYPAQRTCIICDRPIQISIDSQERLHHDSEAAIIYSDGYRLRAFHGLHPKQYFDPDKHKLRMQGYEV
jgi:hypothetical protein